MLSEEKVHKYLERISFREVPGSANFDALKRLQQQHLLKIPFENLDIHLGFPITTDIEKFFEKIVINKRGGFCYELNGLFNELLMAIGFNTKLISARVANAEGGFGEEFDHMAIIVNIDSEEWLVDVGFGEFAQMPLKLVTGIVQKDLRGKFIVEKYDGQYFIVRKLLSDKEFENQYIFSLKERSFHDFEEMCNYHQTSPKSHFTQKKMCSIALTDGRITLTDRNLKITKNNIVTEQEIKDDREFFEKLELIFGIELTKGFHPS